ncbi:hypothetical protein V1477_008967 [Vespula maculifrons]|uniref:Uncharacterized protein n=1 Tax=Vespula maculifrons TaxID=7453 RepID=A0ABD2CGV8_VESMC
MECYCGINPIRYPLKTRGLVWQKPIKSHGSLISRRPLWPFGVSRKFFHAKSSDFIVIFIDEMCHKTD